MFDCLATAEKHRNSEQYNKSEELIDLIRNQIHLQASEERALKKIGSFSDKAFLLKFILSWVLYCLTFAIAVFLYYFKPADRFLLQFYLFAATGPLLMFTSRFSEYRPLWWLNKFGIVFMVFVSATIFYHWHVNHYSYQTLYILILVGMGPLMLTIGTFQQRRLFKVIEKMARKSVP